MSARMLLFLGFLVVAAPALSQVEPAAVGGDELPQNSLQMMVPPILNGALYASTAGADVRQNFFTAAVTVDSAYIDNVLPSGTLTPVADETVSISPHFNYLLSSPRQQVTLDYTPAYTFYTPTSALDSLDQSANGAYQGRLSQSVSLALQDNFIRTSNVFNVSYPFNTGGLSGSTQPPIPAAIAPFEQQTRNTSSATLTYQFSADGMIGGGGLFSEYRFPSQPQTSGLYNSDQTGGTVFYNRRITRRQYTGVKYEFDRYLAYPVNSQVEVQMHLVLPFYSVFFTRTFSLSAAAGAIHADVSQTQQPAIASWSPAVVLSMGWQGDKGNVAANFLRTEISGGGFLGAYNSTSANISGGWKFTRSWTGDASFSYQNVEPQAVYATLPYQGGNSLMAQVSLGRTLGDHVSIEGGYQRLHEQFGGIPIITASPNGNREFVTITYQLRKALGR